MNIFHRFDPQPEAEELPQRLNNPFGYMPHALCRRAYEELKRMVQSGAPFGSEAEKEVFLREREAGKMFGVLVVRTPEGETGWLGAFSGQIGGRFDWPGFAEPVFDFLDEKGHFKKEEREISRLNYEIERLAAEETEPLRDSLKARRQEAEARLQEARCAYQDGKRRRDARRKSGECSASELAEMERESQFQKGELRRLKAKCREELEPHEKALADSESRLEALKRLRRNMSETLQDWLFGNFRMLNGRGEEKPLTEIFRDTAQGVPPSGAGECCAPKLLQAAFRRGWQPLAIAEYWHGASPEGEVRLHGAHYPACRGKCLPILSWMLQGLDVEEPLRGGRSIAGHAAKEPEVVFENQWFCVAQKPAGMLSVPGKGDEVSLQELLQEKYGPERDLLLVHRLDQDTSGLVIGAFGELSQRTLRSMFARRRVRKTYIAWLDGDHAAAGMPPEGRISLPLSADWLDRPRQRVDHAEGKEAVTEYCVLRVQDGMTEVEFRPLTGRTHQLRVHSASPEGLGMPIAGDSLYYKAGARQMPRMMLHAASLEFHFPVDGQEYRFGWEPGREPSDWWTQ